MNNMFLEQTIKFLKDTNINMNKFTETPIRHDEEGQTVYEEMSMVKANNADIEDNIILKFIIIFSLADSFIDIKSPKLVGENFANKVDMLPQNSLDEKVFRECYRIIRVLRNAAVHAQKEFLTEDNIIKYSSKKGKYEEKIEISSKGIRLLFTYFINYISDDYGYKFTKSHKTMINVSYYNEIGREITDFKDKFKDLEKINNSEPFKNILARTRYNVLDANYAVDSTKVSFQQPSKYYPIDYSISYENANYLVPIEVLDENLSINIDELKKWKL